MTLSDEGSSAQRVKERKLQRLIRIVNEEGVPEAVSRTSQFLRGKLASFRRRREWLNLPAQMDLLAEVFRDRFTLVILDACRYDSFEKSYLRFLKGQLRAVRSPTSHTVAWLSLVFRNNAEHLKGARIFSANPYLNSRDIQLSGFRASDYVEEQVVDLWDWGWDPALESVPPDTVLRAVQKEGLKDRNIIWFIQPHFPYIGETKMRFPSEVLDITSVNTASRYLAKQVQSAITSRERLIRAYEDNLALVLGVVGTFVEGIGFSGKVVITSDHGELLGEHGAYAHPSYLDLPEQRIVPWLEINTP